MLKRIGTSNRVSYEEDYSASTRLSYEEDYSNS